MILDKNQNYLTLENAKKSIKKSYIRLCNANRTELQLSMRYEMTTRISALSLGLNRRTYSAYS